MVRSTPVPAHVTVYSTQIMPCAFAENKLITAGYCKYKEQTFWAMQRYINEAFLASHPCTKDHYEANNTSQIFFAPLRENAVEIIRTYKSATQEVMP